MKKNDIFHYGICNFSKHYKASIILGLCIVALSFFISFCLLLSVNLNFNLKKTNLNYLNDRIIFSYSGDADSSYALELIKGNNNNNLNISTKLSFNDYKFVCRHFNNKKEQLNFDEYEILINEKYDFSIGDRLCIFENEYMVKGFFSSNTFDIIMDFDTLPDFNFDVYFSLNENKMKGVFDVLKELNNRYEIDDHNDKFNSFNTLNIIINVVNVFLSILLVFAVISYSLLISNDLILRIENNNIFYNILSICGAKRKDILKIEILGDSIIIAIANLLGFCISLFTKPLLKKIIYRVTYGLATNVLEGFNLDYISVELDHIYFIVSIGVILIPIIIIIFVYMNIKYKTKKSIVKLNEVMYEK